MGGKTGWAAALLLLPLVFGVTNAGGRMLAVSPVTVEVLGKGTVTSSPAGINCGNGAATCYIAFSGSGTVTLTATPATDTDWSFDNWTDCPAAVENTCEVPVDGNSHTVTANFAIPATTTSTLSVTHTGTGNVSGGNINCGSSPAGGGCTWTVLTGSTLTVRQTPGSDNVFTGWGGACSGTNVACTVELAGDRSVSAAWVSSAGVLLTVSVSGNGTVTGAGINCPPTCTAIQSVNSTAVLTATAAEGHIFTGWGGPCSGTASTCAVLMDAAKSVTATFAPVVQLNVTVTGTGNVSGEAGAINCGSNGNVCSASFALNETVSLTATPAVGATFVGWSGACGGTATTCAVLMDAAKSVTATFAPSVQLNVTVTGNGNVSGEAGAINCGSNGNVCSASFALNKTVSLTATPAVSATFVGWSGACGGTATTCTILMSAAKSVTATFASGTTLTVSVSGPGTVTGGGINCGGSATTCTANQTLNASVTLTATPGSGATFTGWGGACSGTTPTCAVSMTSAKTVTATFSGATSSTVPLTVTVTGSGRVTGGGINCGDGATTCSANVTVNASVTLSATPVSGATFTGWGGACSGTSTTCTLTMNAGKSVSATFSSVATTLTIDVTGPGTVSSSAGKCIGSGPKKTCVQSFSVGASVVLTATPGTSARFRGWGGACTGTTTTCTVTLSTAKAVTATFSAFRPPAATAVLTRLGPPRIQRAGSTFRVTLRFKTTQAGIARVRGLRAGRSVTTLSRRVAAGPVTIGPLSVSKSGFYTFEIRLGGRTIRWRTCLGRCFAAAPGPAFVLTREPPTKTRQGDVWSVTLHLRANLISDARIRASRGTKTLVERHFLVRAGKIVVGPFKLGPGSYTFRLTATDAYGRVRTLTWTVALAR